MNKFFCSAPWTGLSIRPDSLLAVCSNNDWCHQVEGKILLSEAINSPEIQNFRNIHQKTTYMESCRLCKFRHDLGFATMRDSYNSLATENADSISYDLKISPDQIFNIDINLSNICNLKCRMCNSFCSSSWHDEQLELSRSFDFISVPKIQAESMIDIDLEKFVNLKSIVLKGGEPLSNKKSIDFLKQIVDMKLSQSLEVSIFTNGYFVDKYIDLLSKFNNLHLSFSFEGVGDLFSYIRGGEKYTFNKFTDNVKLAGGLKNIRTHFMYTPQAYNIFDLSDSVHFLWNEIRPFLTNSLTIEDMKNIFSNILDTPAFLSTAALPLHIRKVAVEKILASEVKRLPMWEPLISYLLAKEDALEYDKFIRYTRKLDTLRSQNIFNYVLNFKNTDIEKKYYEK
jgi:hypothetical protein